MNIFKIKPDRILTSIFYYQYNSHKWTRNKPKQLILPPSIQECSVFTLKITWGGSTLSSTAFPNHVSMEQNTPSSKSSKPSAKYSSSMKFKSSSSLKLLTESLINSVHLLSDSFEFFFMLDIFLSIRIDFWLQFIL